MKRNCKIEDISDGNLYEADDLVTVSCNGCKGAAVCCHGMGNSIILDPFDIYRLRKHLKKKLEELLLQGVELNVVDGIILPNLKMTGQFEGCFFLNKEGKCTIHSVRPGICRIFPLGRYYENRNFKYFLQVNECDNISQTMMKVRKWVDTPDLKQYHQFLVEWHYFLNEVEERIKQEKEDTFIRNINMYVLNQFYIKEFEEEIDFYNQFFERLKIAKEYFGLS